MERGTAAPTRFLAHVYCSQTTGWNGVLLGTELGFGPSDIVLYGDLAAPTERGTVAPPYFPVLH